MDNLQQIIVILPHFFKIVTMMPISDSVLFHINSRARDLRVPPRKRDLKGSKGRHKADQIGGLLS